MACRDDVARGLHLDLSGKEFGRGLVSDCDENAVDGLVGREGVFLPCSFWLVDALLMLERDDEARELFEKLLDISNDLGLLAEEYDPSAKRQLGNFPQAFTHVGLVNSAYNLSHHDSPHQQRSSRR